MSMIAHIHINGSTMITPCMHVVNVLEDGRNERRRKKRSMLHKLIIGSSTTL